MKLYYSAGSCSTSCHISLEESGLKYEAVGVDWDNEKDPNIEKVLKLNPLGTLPVAVIDNKHVLSQNVAIHTYIAEQVPEKNLLPKAGTLERAEAMNWLSFVAADLHKSFAPLFALSQIAPDEQPREKAKAFFISSINRNLKLLNDHLAQREYLLGTSFSVADAYCFVVAGWSHPMSISLKPYPHVESYLGRVGARPAVRKVMAEEGLLES